MAGKAGINLKLNPERQEAIVKLIGQGLTIARACDAVKISHNTYDVWLRRGREEQGGIYCDFLQAIKKAESDFIARNVKIIQDAAQKPQGWVAAAWLLERKLPAEFGRRVEIGMDKDKPLRILHDIRVAARLPGKEMIEEQPEWLELGKGRDATDN